MESPLYPHPPARSASPRTDSRQSNSPSPSAQQRAFSPRPPSAALSPRLNFSAGVPANASLAATYGITDSFPSLAAASVSGGAAVGAAGTQHFVVARPSTSNPYSYRALPVNWEVFNYSLTNATSPQVIAALKSDIFRAHSRLEKLQREYNRSLGRDKVSSPSRPDTARSRLRSELDAIKKGTADVDEIVAEYEGSGRSLELRLKLLELLSARLVALEMQGLQMTEKNALPTSSIVNLSQTFLATQELAEASDAALPLTLSRVPSSFALVERVLDLNQQVEAMRAHTSNLSASNSLINSSQANFSPSVSADHEKDQLQQQQNSEFNNALVEQAVDDLQEQVHMLEKEVGMSHPAVPYGAADQRAPSVITALAVASKLQWFCQRMELIRERNVRFLKKEMDALEQTNRDMGEALQRLKQENQPARPSTAALSGMSNDVNELRRQLHQADEAARSIKATSSKRISELEEQLTLANNRLSDLERQSAAEKESLQKQLGAAQNQLTSERARSQRDTEEHCEAMDRLQRDTERELAELRESASQREVIVAQQNQRLAEMELALTQLTQELNDERYRRQVADREAEEKLAVASANVEHFQRLCESESLAQSNASSQIFVSLQNELHEVKSVLERLQRQKKSQNSAQEAYPRLELELFQVRSELQQSRIELEKTKQYLAAMEQLKDEQLAQLRIQTQQGVAVSADDIIREEMKHMKNAFELKLAHTKEELARKVLEHSQQIRQLQEKFERDLQSAKA